MALRRSPQLVIVAPLLVTTLFALNDAAAAPACTPPSGVTTHRFPGDLPAALKQSLDKTGPIAAPGESFCLTDVCNGGPFSRMAFVWSRDNRWVLAVERGGIAYRVDVLAYDLAADGAANVVTLPSVGQSETVCDTAEHALTAP